MIVILIINRDGCSLRMASDIHHAAQDRGYTATRVSDGRRARLPLPSLERAAQAADSCCRHDCCAQTGRRRRARPSEIPSSDGRVPGSVLLPLVALGDVRRAPHAIGSTNGWRVRSGFVICPGQDVPLGPP